MSIVDDDPFDRSMNQLREDAIQRGMLDLSLVYGWSMMKRRAQIFELIMKELKEDE